MIGAIVDKLRSAQSVVLSTHRNCDGDGLGAQLALFHGLRMLGKSVRIINLDRAPRKYGFLDSDRWIEIFSPGKTEVPPADLALIFDTNDSRLVEPLFGSLRAACRETLFIDHHPILALGPEPTLGSLIDTSAASTGELTFQILKRLKVPLDATIARALYTSIVFDTQLFRYVKSAPSSHLLAAELLAYEKEPEEIHRRLFSSYTVQKMAFLARSLGQVEYSSGNRIAFVRLKADEIRAGGLDLDESGDVIDMIMNVESIEAAALVREDAPGEFKVSLRSKGKLEVLSIAESLGGGGHHASAGAYVQGSFEPLRERLLKDMARLIDSGSKR